MVYSTSVLPFESTGMNWAVRLLRTNVTSPLHRRQEHTYLEKPPMLGHGCFPSRTSCMRATSTFCSINSFVTSKTLFPRPQTLSCSTLSATEGSSSAGILFLCRVIYELDGL